MWGLLLENVAPPHTAPVDSYAGLSECTASELRRFHAIQPVSAVQMECVQRLRRLQRSVLGLVVVCCFLVAYFSVACIACGLHLAPNCYCHCHGRATHSLSHDYPRHGRRRWSLQSRVIEADIVPACRELGVAIVAYSPLGRGFLSGTFKTAADLDEKDWRLYVCARASTPMLLPCMSAL
jgi:hypothetical protein